MVMDKVTVSKSAVFLKKWPKIDPTEYIDIEKAAYLCGFFDWWCRLADLKTYAYYAL